VHAVWKVKAEQDELVEEVRLSGNAVERWKEEKSSVEAESWERNRP